MDPVTASLVAGGIGEIGGSVLGDILGAGDREHPDPSGKYPPYDEDEPYNPKTAGTMGGH